MMAIKLPQRASLQAAYVVSDRFEQRCTLTEHAEIHDFDFRVKTEPHIFTKKRDFRSLIGESVQLAHLKKKFPGLQA